MEDQPAPTAQDTQNTQETQDLGNNTNQVPSDENTQNISDDELMDLFIDGLMAQKGIDPPTEEIQKALHDDLKAQLLNEIDRSLVSALPDDKLTELYQKAEASGGNLDPQEVAAAIEAANVDTTEVIGATMQQFGKLYLHPESADSAQNEMANSTLEPTQNMEQGA